MYFSRKKLIVILIPVLIVISTVLSWQKPASASPSLSLDFSKLKEIHIQKVLSNKQLVKDAKRFLKTTPDTVCQAYLDRKYNTDHSAWKALEKGATSAVIVTKAVHSASVAGAGSLSGYAGMASAVSELGLGGLTSTVAGIMGHNVAGAAATSVVTSAVGGPLMMGAIVVGGTSVAAVGTYKLGKLAVNKLGNWAEVACQ